MPFCKLSVSIDLIVCRWKRKVIKEYTYLTLSMTYLQAYSTKVKKNIYSPSLHSFEYTTIKYMSITHIILINFKYNMWCINTFTWLEIFTYQGMGRAITVYCKICDAKVIFLCFPSFLKKIFFCILLLSDFFFLVQFFKFVYFFNLITYGVSLPPIPFVGV